MSVLVSCKMKGKSLWWHGNHFGTMKLEALLHKHGSSASNSGYQNVASFVCGGIEMLTGSVIWV